jgi:RNA polymerase sigma factor (sigma-70 family)
MSSFDWRAITPFVAQARDARAQAAFEVIFCRVWPLALGFVLGNYGRTLTPEDAEDVLMQTFAITWQELPKLRKPAAFGGYFFTILARNCIAACRLKLAAAVFDGSDEAKLDSLALLTPELAAELGVAAAQDDPYMHLVSAELVEASLRRLRRVYEKLTPRQRLVFEARVVNQFDETEAVRRTGLALGTVRGAYRRILELLQKEFQAAEFRNVPALELRLAFLAALAIWRQRGAGGFV